MTTPKNAVLITGARGGIGMALCSVFRRSGYYVLATDLIQQAVDCECDFYIRADLSAMVREEETRHQFLENISESISGRNLKGLINNAAVQKLSHLENIKLAEFQESIDVNVSAPLLLIQMFQESLTRARGSVVNIGSIHSRLTKPSFVSYATSKAALLGLTKSLAVDLGGRIRINIIQPGATDTEMLRAGFRNKETAYARLKDYHPANRLAKPEEIAAAALFLVSDQSASITGTALDINGGIAVRLHDPE
jgi:NAD(P)-dependent dehydrogenase (short-subunit alcohol dehydrogenase family)